MTDEVVVPTPRRPVWRAVRGTLILAGIGAGVGFVLGTTLLTGLLASHGLSRYDLPLGMLFGGGSGALAGAIGAPLMGWLVLRPVPLGRALVWTALGTFVGGLAFILGVNASPVVGGVIGFVAGGIGARLRTAQLARGASPDALPTH